MNDTPKEPKKNDLAEIFDLDRSQMIARMTGNFENCLRDIQSAQDDLKELKASCKESGLGPRDVEAMATVARLRLKDEAGAAREKLEALQRVGKACGLDLFSWTAGE